MTGAETNFPVSSIRGGTDVYSYDQNLIFANGLSYQPRPVMQSYSAYTAELARLNAAHLRSARAAENILFTIQTIDHRFPSLDDGCSWPELLTRYDIKRVLRLPDKFLLLSRARQPQEYRLKPLADATISFGEAIPIPAATNGPIWVEMEINKSLLGRVITTLYKPPGLRLKVTLKDAQQLDYRLTRTWPAAVFYCRH